MNDQEFPSTTPLLLMGIFLAILGVISIATPAVAGTAVIVVIGGLLLLAGVVQVVSGLRTEAGLSKLPPVILGVITAIAGLGVLGHPLLGLKFLTLLLAIFFTVEGIWKVIASFSYRPAAGWLALLLSGLVTLVLGILIYSEWPMSGLWAVGVLVGVDLLMTGISVIAVATTIKQLQQLKAAE
jgi:uncharacterized membrane protein HdeD (DUF308 family)